MHEVIGMLCFLLCVSKLWSCTLMHPLTCNAGCYTAMAQNIDNEGNLIDPIKAPWLTGGAFTTPPGWWHIHVNETDEDAWVLPIQDAGLLTHQVFA